MMNFEYFNPVRLVFGPGAFGRLGECVDDLGERALLVTGRAAAHKHGFVDRAMAMFADHGVEAMLYDAIPPNPTDAIIDEGGRLPSESGRDVIVGLGGGSAMDAAKAIAVAATHDGPICGFLMPDRDGSKRVPTDATLPIVCVTTTSGTSSELTPFAVVTVESSHEKNAIADSHMYARIGICDPELTYPLPPRITAATAVDVLCHAVEGYISTVAQPLTDRAVEEAIRLVGLYLQRAVEDGGDEEARYHMSLANVFAGVALSNCGATIMHALEHPVSAHYPEVSHGEGLAALLIAYAETYWQAMPQRFARVSVLLGGPDDATGAAHVLRRLLDGVDMNVKLSDLGVAEEMLERLADDASRYMGRALGKTPGATGREALIELLRASY